LIRQGAGILDYPFVRRNRTLIEYSGYPRIVCLLRTSSIVRNWAREIYNHDADIWRDAAGRRGQI